VSVVPSDKLVPVDFFELWAEREQRRMERANELMGGDDWAERLDERTPGPRWAWMLDVVPLIGIVGTIAIVVDAWLRKYRGRGL
jgi:hypothetical protein